MIVVPAERNNKTNDTEEEGTKKRQAIIGDHWEDISIKRRGVDEEEEGFWSRQMLVVLAMGLLVGAEFAGMRQEN